MEGPLVDVIEFVKAGHRACLEAGAKNVVTIVKIVESATGTTIADKVGKYRG